MHGFRRSFPLLPLLGALTVALGDEGCRRFELCSGDPAGCRSPGEAGASAEGGTTGDLAGGTAGDGGESSGAADCTAPLLECDHSTLTRCETNTDHDPLNCGACDVPCTGACANGRCIELLQVTTDDVVYSITPAASTDYIYYLADSGTDQTVLMRLSKKDGSVSVVLDALNRVDSVYGELAVGLDRVYFLESDNLKSVTTTGDPVLSDEHIATGTAPVVNGSFLYAWTWDETLLRRELDSEGGEDEIRPWPALDTVRTGELEAFGSGIVIATNFAERGTPRWELHTVSWPDVERIASGDGVVKRVRTKTDQNYAVMFLVADSDYGGPTELWGWDQAIGPIMIERENAFTDFCLSRDMIYGAVRLESGNGIRLLTRTKVDYGQAGFRPNPFTLLCDGGMVYFTEWTDHPSGLLGLRMEDLSP